MEQVGERRKYQRYDLLSNVVAYVRLSRPNCATAGRITNISMGGLKLFHLCGKLSPEVSLELDIAVPGEINLLEKLSGKIVFDCKSQSENIGAVSARQCGILFKDLTDGQRSYLRHLIDNHTTDN